MFVSCSGIPTSIHSFIQQCIFPVGPESKKKYQYPFCFCDTTICILQFCAIGNGPLRLALHIRLKMEWNFCFETRAEHQFRT